MNNLISATFEAHHREKNHHLRYELVVGRDLLGAWTVAIAYGRTAQRSVSAEEPVTERIRRRNAEPGIDVETTEILPARPPVCAETAAVAHSS